MKRNAGKGMLPLSKRMNENQRYKRERRRSLRPTLERVEHQGSKLFQNGINNRTGVDKKKMAFISGVSANLKKEKKSKADKKAKVVSVYTDKLKILPSTKNK